MQYGEAVQSLKKNDLRRLYLIAGEEKYLAQKFFTRLLEKLLPDGDSNAVTRLDETATIHDVTEACLTMPFFCAKNIVYLHNNAFFKDKKSKKTVKNEEILQKLFAQLPDFTTLIIETEEMPDKRRKLYKLVAKYGIVVEAAPVKAYNISQWLHSKFNEIGKLPDAQAYDYLQAAINIMPQVSLGFLDKEIDKLALFTDRRDIRKDDLVHVLSGLPGISAFAIAEAAGNKDVKRALYLLEMQLKNGMHPLNIFMILSRHIHQLWQINYLLQQRADKYKIAKRIGVVPFIAQKLMAQARRFDLSTLHRAISNLADVDYKLKSGQDRPGLLEDLLIQLCR